MTHIETRPGAAQHAEAVPALVDGALGRPVRRGRDRQRRVTSWWQGPARADRVTVLAVGGPPVAENDGAMLLAERPPARVPRVAPRGLCIELGTARAHTGESACLPGQAGADARRLPRRNRRTGGGSTGREDTRWSPTPEHARLAEARQEVA